MTTADDRAIQEMVDHAKKVDADYYRVTGKPLGSTREIGEWEAARLLNLRLSETRTAGYDATDVLGFKYQIKARSLSERSLRKPQRLGSINLKHEFHAVLFVLMDEHFETLEIWQAERAAVREALAVPGTGPQNERGTLSISKFQRFARQIY